MEQEVRARFARKRPVRLKTEGAFHTYYMVEAAQHFRSVLEAAEFDLSDVRVLSNFTGGYHEADPVDIRARLFFQLFHPVMWNSNLQTAFGDAYQDDSRIRWRDRRCQRTRRQAAESGRHDQKSPAHRQTRSTLSGSDKQPITSRNRQISCGAINNAPYSFNLFSGSSYSKASRPPVTLRCRATNFIRDYPGHLSDAAVVGFMTRCNVVISLLVRVWSS